MQWHRFRLPQTTVETNPDEPVSSHMKQRDICPSSAVSREQWLCPDLAPPCDTFPFAIKHFKLICRVKGTQAFFTK
uniref:Uncharacterized protein n=1 Tax=Anguilla anguilla TaxID=7936 RepID=A0A0E9XHT6_ANGAN